MMPRSKIECARLVAAGHLVETFSHETLGSFNITELREIILALAELGGLKTRRCRFDEMEMVDGIPMNAVEYLIANREIDEGRAALLTHRQLKEPILFLICPPGSNGDGESHLLVDGIHRLFERRKRGKEFVDFYLFPLDLAPRINEDEFQEVPWGRFDLVPGVGLVNRK